MHLIALKVPKGKDRHRIMFYSTIRIEIQKEHNDFTFLVTKHALISKAQRQSNLDP